MTVPLAAIYQGGFSAHPITAKFAQANLQLLIHDARSITLPPDDTGPAQPEDPIPSPDRRGCMGLGQQERRPAGRSEAAHLQQGHRHSRARDHRGRVRRRHDDRPGDQGHDVRHAHRRRRRLQIPGERRRRHGWREFLHELPRLAREKGRRPRHRPEKAPAVRRLPQSHFVPHRGLVRRFLHSRARPWSLGIFTWFSRRK